MTRHIPDTLPENKGNMKYWLFLLAAIVLEVGGTAIMKSTQSMPGWWVHGGYGLMLLCIGFSYYFLALSTQRLPVGVAFACWEGLGLTLITACSVVLLGESFSLTRFGALVAVLSGVMLIHHGTEHGTTDEHCEGDAPCLDDHLAEKGARS